MKNIKSILFSLAIVGILFTCVLVYSEIQHNKMVRPPEGKVTLDEFLSIKQRICCTNNVVIDGKPHTLVLGRFDTYFLALPSGLPAYIFDEQNVLVAWCGDTGNNSTFVKKWFPPDLTHAECAQKRRTEK